MTHTSGDIQMTHPHWDTDIPSPSENAANRPDLSFCPHCGHPLGSTETETTYRGCAFVYDADSFAIPVWTHLRAHTRPWLFSGLGSTITLSAGGVLWLVLYLITTYWEAVVVVLFAALLSRFISTTRPPKAARICSPEGIAIRVRRKKRYTQLSWDDCQEIYQRPAVNDSEREHDEVSEIMIKRTWPTGRPIPAEVVLVPNSISGQVIVRLNEQLEVRGDPRPLS